MKSLDADAAPAGRGGGAAGRNLKWICASGGGGAGRRLRSPGPLPTAAQAPLTQEGENAAQKHASPHLAGLREPRGAYR